MKEVSKKWKKKVITVCLIAILMIVILPPYAIGYMFGKKYDNEKDYTCCKQDQLFIHHYYDINWFWVKVDYGYDLVPFGKPADAGCIVLCDN